MVLLSAITPESVVMDQSQNGMMFKRTSKRLKQSFVEEYESNNIKGEGRTTQTDTSVGSRKLSRSGVRYSRNDILLSSSSTSGHRLRHSI